MFAKEDLDILNVVTTDNRHADVTIDGARAGVKGIYCEKPLATNLDDANRMIKACEENGTVLITGYTRRFRPIYHTVREEIRAGSIGPLTTMVATMGGDRGKLFFHCSHIISSVTNRAQNYSTHKTHSSRLQSLYRWISLFFQLQTKGGYRYNWYSLKYYHRHLK